MYQLKTISIPIVFILFIAVPVFSQTGGSYEITQSVISNGGGTSGGGTFSLTGTIAQPLAGTNSTAGQYGVRGGFWQSSFAPTAASVAVSGRVLQPGGKGVFKAEVTLIHANGSTRRATTNFYGYFRFDDVETGQTCIINVRHKRFQFGNETQVVFVAEEITDIVFNALP